MFQRRIKTNSIESLLRFMVRARKLHGSLYWFKTEHNKIVKIPIKTCDTENVVYYSDEKLSEAMIYPTVIKELEATPYLFLRNVFKSKLLAASLLIVVGYSYRDKMILDIVREQLNANPNLWVLIIDLYPDEVKKRIIEFHPEFDTRALFTTQRHRIRMDPRRITIHLIKPVGGRRYNAEVDRVWDVTPGPLLQATTYVLECKWGLVQKRHLDDFFNVLRWSKDFGVDTPDGRQIEQGITGVFAGSAFDPKETVRLKDETVISVPSYAAS